MVLRVGRTMKSSAAFVLLSLLLLSFAAEHLKVQAQETETEDAPPVVKEEIGSIPAASTTDTNTAQREKESISKSGEKFQFQAEVSRLMEIIINSLYSNKDIFLRELISNASDALDKIRYMSLTDKSVIGEGDDTKLEIKIQLDKENKVLRIRDRGIGMTKEDLIKNLGTIAKSGTSAFLDQMNKGGDLNLIGQFGVGFYSVYLVADFVEVHSKHNNDKQYVWASKADGNFEVYEDEDQDLGRGTEIVIHLKEDSAEYLSEDKLSELVKKYSQFINFPIYLWKSKDVDVPQLEEEEETSEEPSDETEETAEGDEEVTEEEEEEEEYVPKTKRETQWEWELLNDVKAVWLRNPKEVKDEEYQEFYKSISKDFSTDKPISFTHFNAEGDVEFKAIMFVPPKAPYDYYDNYYSNKSGLKLFVRRVFISDEFEDLLPKYLSFLKGVIDSDTLPLNVSREMLQQHSSLKTIKKKLVRKALDMIRKMAEEEEKEKEKEEGKEKDDAEDATATEEEETKTEEKGKYTSFWKEFGKALKLGVIEDSSNRMRLAKLLRFQSSKSGEGLVSLDEYIARMKTGQKQIYFLTGQSKEQLEKSPFLEKLLKKDYEVLYLTDAVDEYLMQNLTEYEDKKFQNASKEDLKIGKKDKEREKEVKESFKGLTTWWKDTLGEGIESVKISNRLAETPCVVVTSKYGWSANMERIMTSQALGDASRQAFMRGRKILEINPRHPIITKLKDLVDEDVADEEAKHIATLLYDTALLESGFVLEDPTTFAGRIYDTVKSSLNIDKDAQVEEETEEDEAPTTGDSADAVEDKEEREEDHEDFFSKVKVVPDSPTDENDGEKGSEGDEVVKDEL